MINPDETFDFEGYPTIIADTGAVGLGTFNGDDCLYVRAYNKERDLQMVLPLTRDQASDFASQIAKMSFLLRNKKEDRS